MWNPFQSTTDFLADQELIRRRSYGVIVAENEQLIKVQFRPWPKLISTSEMAWLGGIAHNKRQANRCVLYFNQPRFHPSFLALKYVVSNAGASYATFRRCLIALDQIAWIKRSDAIVCEASNLRLSDRFMKRMGWERHFESSSRRHFIKRFYGNYPDHAVLKPISLPWTIDPSSDGEVSRSVLS